MDVCILKPLVATCGSDKSVRIWNYQEKTAEGVKVFEEDAHSIAFHPSGLYVLVGFTDKLRLLSLLMDDMRLVRELPVKACKEAKFSNGGHLFAAVNQATVQVFDAYTCEVKVQLRGHQQNVKSVLWAEKDRRLVSIGKDGNIFLWEVRTGERLAEFMQPRASFYDGALHGDAVSNSSRLFVACNDSTIRSFNASTLVPELNDVVLDSPLGGMTLASNGRALFTGNAEANSPSMLQTFIMKNGQLVAKLPRREEGVVSRDSAATRGA